MIELVPYHPSMASRLLEIWQDAEGGWYPIMPALWRDNTSGDPGFDPQDLLVAAQGDEPVGFALAKVWRGEFPGCERFRDVGHVALMAVAPRLQGQGIGTRLLAAAETRLVASGVRRLELGGSFHHFFPGIPSLDPRLEAFFAHRGYALGQEVWDVRRDLGVPPDLPDVDADVARAGADIRLYRPEEKGALLGFLCDTFAGRWARDTAVLLERETPSRVMGLFVAGEPLGFAHLHPPGAPGALRWAGFDPGVAALGPIGVSGRLRGQGLGLALLVRGLEELRARGARQTVIDWTDLLDFYARCGFTPFLRYRLARKEAP